MAIKWDDEETQEAQEKGQTSFGIGGGITMDKGFIKAQSSLSQSQRLFDNVFSQKPKDVGFQSPLTQMDPTGEMGEHLVKNSPTTVGAIAGGLGGAALGAAGGPAGAFAGGIAGTTAGAALGETVRQKVTGAALDPIKAGKAGLEFGALQAIGGPAASLLGKGIKAVGRGVAKAVIPKSMQESERILGFKAANPLWERVKNVFTGAKTKGVEPITAGETAFQKGLLGPESWVGTQAKRESKQIWKEVLEPKIDASKTQHDMTKFFDEVEKQIVKDNTELGRQADLKEALAAMREEYAGKTVASTRDMQSFKEGWAKFVPEKAYRGKPIAGSYKEVQNIAASKAREILYKEVGEEGKQAFIDYGNLQALEELGAKAIQEGTLPVGGTATLMQHLLQKVAIPVGTVGGQTIYKVGEGIEIIGGPGAKTVRDVVGTLGGVGRESEEDTSMFGPSLQNMQ